LVFSTVTETFHRRETAEARIAGRRRNGRGPADNAKSISVAETESSTAAIHLFFSPLYKQHER
jgi:hypothetical protein